MIPNVSSLLSRGSAGYFQRPWRGRGSCVTPVAQNKGQPDDMLKCVESVMGLSWQSKL